MGKRSRKRSGQPEGSASSTGTSRAERDAARRQRAQAEKRGEREAVARREDECRLLIEDMLLAPQDYKWVRVSNADIGEPGCKNWHVRPRLGPFGMLMNWWRVKISSGCPLAEGSGA